MDDDFSLDDLNENDEGEAEWNKEIQNLEHKFKYLEHKAWIG